MMDPQLSGICLIRKTHQPTQLLLLSRVPLHVEKAPEPCGGHRRGHGVFVDIMNFLP